MNLSDPNTQLILAAVCGVGLILFLKWKKGQDQQRPQPATYPQPAPTPTPHAAPPPPPAAAPPHPYSPQAAAALMGGTPADALGVLGTLIHKEYQRQAEEWHLGVVRNLVLSGPAGAPASTIQATATTPPEATAQTTTTTTSAPPPRR